MAYTFDGVNKLIILSSGTTTVNAQDMYSRWVDWVATDDNSKFLPAFRTVGGDSISQTQAIAAYYFLLNGWRIRPYEGNHTLTITGNLFVDEGGSPFVSTVGNYNVLISLMVSSDSKTIAVGSGVTSQDKIDIVAGIMGEIIDVFSMKESLQLILSVLAGKSSGGGTSNIVFRDMADTKTRIAASVDTKGNRLEISTDTD